MEIRGIEGHHPTGAKIFRAKGEVHAHLIFDSATDVVCRVDFPGPDEIAEHPELAHTARVSLWETSGSMVEVMGELRQLAPMFSAASRVLERERYHQLRSIARQVVEDDQPEGV